MRECCKDLQETVQKDVKSPLGKRKELPSVDKNRIQHFYALSGLKSFWKRKQWFKF